MNKLEDRALLMIMLDLIAQEYRQVRASGDLQQADELLEKLAREMIGNNA